MSQVRAALSEDRRYGTPEEEIEALWLEVDRMTREHRQAADSPVIPEAERQRDDRPASDVIPKAAPLDDLDVSRAAGAASGAASDEPSGEPAPDSESAAPPRRGFLVPYVPLEMPILTGPEDSGDPPPRSRPRSKLPP